MNSVVLSGGLRVTYPDGFVVMSEEDLLQVYRKTFPGMWGIWDRNLHAALTVHPNDGGGASKLFGKVVSTRDLAERAEKQARKSLKRKGYELGGFFETQIGGSEAQGFDYTYRAGDVVQMGKIVIARRDTLCYTIFSFERAEGNPEGHEAIEAILGSMAFE